jgi:PAS domain S-box-containing protein
MPLHHELISPLAYTVLILESSSTDREQYRHYFLTNSDARYALMEVDSVRAAAALCLHHVVDAVLVDGASDQGLTMLQELQSHFSGHHPPIIVVASESDPAVVVQAMKSGAEDYLLKQTLTPEQLQLTTLSAIETAQLRLQLQHQEERFRVSVENLLDCFGCFSAIRDEHGQIVDFRIDYLNKAACEDNGLSRPMQIGKRLCKLLPAYRETGLFDDYCRVVETGEPLVKESLIYDNSAEQQLVRAFDLQVTKLDDGFVASWRDVTDRKHLEFELNQRITDLQQQQQRLQRLIEIIPVGIGIATDPSCASMQHNAYLRQLLGVSPGQNISKSAPTSEQPAFQVLQNGQELPAEDLPMQQAARLGVEVQGTEIEIVWPDGNVRHLLSYAAPVRDDHHQINGAIGAFLDISDRKRIETQLRQSHEQLINTLESITDAFFSLDEAWNFTFVNPQAAALLHKTPAELVGQNVWSVFPEAVGSVFDQFYHQAMAEQVTVQFEAFYPPLESWFEVRAYPRQGGLAVYFQDATDRRASEARLQDSEERLRLALKATGLGIWDWDIQQDRVTWAGDNEKLFGLPQGSFAGTYEAFLDCVHPNDRTAVQQCVANALAEKRGYVQEFRVVYPDGTLHWLKTQSELFLDKQGNPVRLVGTNQDVTASKQAQADRERLLAQLETEHSFLEQTLQQMPSGVVIAEAPSGKLLFQNGEAMQLLRHPMPDPETYAGYAQYGEFYSAGQLYHPDDYPLARSIRLGEAVKAEEVYYRRSNGTEAIFSVNAAPILNSDGHRIAAVCTFEDISNRKQIEEKLRQSEERYRYLADLIPQLVWIADTSGVLLDVNDRWSVYTGFTLEQAQVQGWEAIVHPEDVPILTQSWMVAQQEGTRYQAEGRMRRLDGVYRWHLHQAMPLKNEQGQIVRWFGTATDIHELKLIEAERAQLLVEAEAARAEAEAANRSKDDFVSLVAHELRSPLNAIMGWAKLLQTRQLNAATMQKALETITRNSQAQAQLIEDLLDVSRMVHGSLRLTMTSVDLVTVIEAAVETVRPTVEARALHLETYLHPLEAISGDAQRLQQVVLNLLTNAIKFTPEGGRVQIGLEQQDQQVQIQVSDTGKGISPDLLPHIFKRFRQDQQNATAKQGLGLGLAIVKYIVEQHGGTITAHSRGEGQGATFTVRLPLSPHPTVQEHEIQAGGWSADATHPLSEVRVLLVDDDLDMLTLTTLILEQAGAIVQTATSATAALERLAQFQPDLLISDIAMPGQNGYELLRQVQAAMNPIPAIALTAYSSEVHQADSLRAGFARHLIKPIETKALVSVVLDVLQRRAR